MFGVTIVSYSHLASCKRKVRHVQSSNAKQIEFLDILKVNFTNKVSLISRLLAHIRCSQFPTMQVTREGRVCWIIIKAWTEGMTNPGRWCSGSADFFFFKYTCTMYRSKSIIVPSAELCSLPGHMDNVVTSPPDLSFCGNHVGSRFKGSKVDV